MLFKKIAVKFLETSYQLKLTYFWKTRFQTNKNSYQLKKLAMKVSSKIIIGKKKFQIK